MGALLRSSMLSSEVWPGVHPTTPILENRQFNSPVGVPVVTSGVVRVLVSNH
jgi:hypothetical protein